MTERFANQTLLLSFLRPRGNNLRAGPRRARGQSGKQLSSGSLPPKECAFRNTPFSCRRRHPLTGLALAHDARIIGTNFLGHNR
jgi:hypothetical protein